MLESVMSAALAAILATQGPLVVTVASPVQANKAPQEQVSSIEPGQSVNNVRQSVLILSATRALEKIQSETESDQIHDKPISR